MGLWVFLKWHQGISSLNPPPYSFLDASSSLRSSLIFIKTLYPPYMVCGSMHWTGFWLSLTISSPPSYATFVVPAQVPRARGLGDRASSTYSFYRPCNAASNYYVVEILISHSSFPKTKISAQATTLMSAVCVRNYPQPDY